MGTRLLRKMGWRHGQGIGAKVRRRKKKSALIGEYCVSCVLLLLYISGNETKDAS